MKILNALDLKSGKKADNKYRNIFTSRPLQFLSESDKDDEWHKWNLDWLEWNGIIQLRRKARRLLKNYKLAAGIIDKSDYVIEEDNEYKDVLETLTQDDPEALSLKFYPIIPNVINTLVNEFSKRDTNLTFKSVDDLSYNELISNKYSMLENTLVKRAESKLAIKLIEMGIDQDTDQFKQALSPENVKSLPEIENFFRKDYKSLSEQWAIHQYESDKERFNIEELEETSFRDSLITDSEFWHFMMKEDDYDIELWNPVLTFYHKSPNTKYISNGNYVGKVDMLTLPDVIDKYGWLMTQDQHETLESLYPTTSPRYTIGGYQNDGTFYNPTISHKANVEDGSLGFKQFTSFDNNWLLSGDDIIKWIIGESEDYQDFASSNLFRVTTAYWKSQKKVGHLTKIDDLGNVITAIVSENYKITDPAIYNNTLLQEKSDRTLVFGEHIEWIWINEVRGGVKINPSNLTFISATESNGVEPIYIGINQNKAGRLKFQFKGEHTLYGCKLPVEGRVYTDRNTRSVSLVDILKPWQISYNIVNNQISDILIDELGTVILLDQNALPQHSLGEDWGKHNLSKAYVAMKDFQMLPLDSSITNTENALSFQHYQQLNMEQTNRLLGRVQLANFFKQQAFENIGISPQRMGQAIEQETAEGIRAAVNNSYTQTEQFFIAHTDNLMPRVHQMRTDLAQYYMSNKKSVRLDYLASNEEKVNFEIFGDDLLLRDINIFATTKSVQRNILERLRQLAMSNNTTGATIYDLGNLLKAKSVTEISQILKSIEEKTNANIKQQREHETQLEQAKLQNDAKEKQLSRDFEATQKEAERRKDILVAEIRAAGYGSLVDINQNQQSDFSDQMKEIRKSQEFREQMDLKREKETNSLNMNKEKINLEKEKLATQKKISEDKVNIARTNKNQYDVKKSKNEK